MNIEDVRDKLKRYESFLNKDPSNVDLVCEVADLRMQLGTLESAQQILSDALCACPEHPGLLYRKASVFMAQGNTGGAIDILQSLINVGNYAPAFHYNLAYAFLYESRIEEAKAQLDILADDVTSLPEILLLRARVLHHLGEMDNAISSAEDYVKKQPNNAEALGVLALLHFDMGAFEAAGKWAQKSLQADEDNLESLVTLGSLALDREDTAGARSYFEPAIAKHAKSGRAWSGMGLTDMLSLDIRQATVDLKNAVAYMPNHIGTWHALAWCQIIANDLASAEQCFKQAMDIDHNFSENHGGLAVLAVLQGQIDNAETMAKRAVRLDPMSFSGRFAQSLLLNQSGDSQAAHKIVQNILSHRFDNGSLSLQKTLAQAMRKNNNPPHTP